MDHSASKTKDQTANDVLNRRRPDEARADTVVRGRFALLAGCMFAAKTTELIRRVQHVPLAGVLAVKHRIDTRFRLDHIVTHDGCQIEAVALSAARDIPERVTNSITLVAIDEAHFFDESLVCVIEEVAERGIDVIATSLDLDSWGRPFPIAARLADLADRVWTFHATCAACGGQADRTQRLTPIHNGQMVGGSESYEPRCRTCWRPPPEPWPGANSS